MFFFFLTPKDFHLQFCLLKNLLDTSQTLPLAHFTISLHIQISFYWFLLYDLKI